MIDLLSTMLKRESIIIRDENTLDELRNMVKFIRPKSDGTRSIKMAAKKGKHDDRVAALWIYAGSLDMRQIEGRKTSGWSLL